MPPNGFSLGTPSGNTFLFSWAEVEADVDIVDCFSEIGEKTWWTEKAN